MDEIKATIRANLLALLRAEEGELSPGENGTTRLAKRASKKGSWGQRLLDETDIGVSVVAEAARMFGLQPWQLLVPKLDPAARPALSGDASAWPFPMVRADGYWALPPEDRAWVQSKIDSAIQERAEAIRRRAPQDPSPIPHLAAALKTLSGPDAEKKRRLLLADVPTESPPSDPGTRSATGAAKRRPQKF